MSIQTSSPSSSAKDYSNARLSPIVVARGHLNDRQVIYTCLLDSGSRHSYISPTAVPADFTPRTVKGHAANTIIGESKIIFNKVVDIQNLCFPQLSPSRYINAKFEVFVGLAPISYDLVLGRDFLIPNGFDILSSLKSIRWIDRTIPFVDELSLRQPDLFDRASDPVPDAFAAQIMDSLYDQVDLDDMILKLDHFPAKQRAELQKVVSSFRSVFTQRLRRHTGADIEINLKAGAVPKTHRAYPVAEAHMQTFRKELDRLVDQDVLERCPASKWSSPTFIIPKKEIGRASCRERV